MGEYKHVLPSIPVRTTCLLLYTADGNLRFIAVSGHSMRITYSDVMGDEIILKCLLSFNSRSFSK